MLTTRYFGPLDSPERDTCDATGGHAWRCERYRAGWGCSDCGANVGLDRRTGPEADRERQAFVDECIANLTGLLELDRKPTWLGRARDGVLAVGAGLILMSPMIAAIALWGLAVSWIWSQ
jgi:hypothetical protein